MTGTGIALRLPEWESLFKRISQQKFILVSGGDILICTGQPGVITGFGEDTT
jgi:hypothetical protein